MYKLFKKTQEVDSKYRVLYLSDIYKQFLIFFKKLSFSLTPRIVPKRDIIVETEEKLQHIEDATDI